MKLIINKRFGGFSLSKEAQEMYRSLTTYYFDDDINERTDVNLIKVVETLGEKANGRFANLKVVELPDGAFYELNEYDGYEYVQWSETEIHHC